jgi:hypothetical protein
LAPNLLVLLEGIENHNILLLTKPMETFDAMFVNRITTIFSIDLLFAVLVFFVWSYFEAKRLRIPKIWKYWLFTMLFGLAGGFPLFLWAREKYLGTRIN